jgi:acetyltransferase-like isoleucine patch superfamily enzyme
MGTVVPMSHQGPGPQHRRSQRGDNVWLGGGVILCPGVSIGENTVVRPVRW